MKMKIAIVQSPGKACLPRERPDSPSSSQRQGKKKRQTVYPQKQRTRKEKPSTESSSNPYIIRTGASNRTNRGASKRGHGLLPDQVPTNRVRRQDFQHNKQQPFTYLGLLAEDPSYHRGLWDWGPGRNRPLFVRLGGLAAGGLSRACCSDRYPGRGVGAEEGPSIEG